MNRFSRTRPKSRKKYAVPLASAIVLAGVTLLLSRHPASLPQTSFWRMSLIEFDRSLRAWRLSETSDTFITRAGRNNPIFLAPSSYTNFSFPQSIYGDDGEDVIVIFGVVRNVGVGIPSSGFLAMLERHITGPLTRAQDAGFVSIVGVYEDAFYNQRPVIATDSIVHRSGLGVRGVVEILESQPPLFWDQFDWDIPSIVKKLDQHGERYTPTHRPGDLEFTVGRSTPLVSLHHVLIDMKRESEASYWTRLGLILLFGSSLAVIVGHLVFYTGKWMASVRIARVRKERSRQGHCVSCAYPLVAGATHCPECGATYEEAGVVLAT